ncbi:MAG TPA: hypothetical protein VE775_06145, partial [Pyrinomonadaceae bacterium]|nr:hypothetical protein [Pyrinomonadaceae bacterium]
MKRARSLLTICLWLALSAPAAEARNAAKDSAWLSVRSPNYLFVGDAAAADMQQIARCFEQFRAVFAAQFPAAGLHATVPTVVFVFRDE